MKYYELFDDMYHPQKWYLGCIYREKLHDIDDNIFVLHVPKNTECLNTDAHVPGVELDFTTLDTRSIPIVSEAFKNCFDNIQDISFIPVNIVGQACQQQHYIMVIHSLVDCVDETRSDFRKFIENDPVRPDLAGQYRAFLSLKLDYSRIDNAGFFRINKATNCMIASEQVKNKCEVAGLTGMTFTEV